VAAVPLTMRWPARRSRPRDQLAFSWAAGALAYVHAILDKHGLYQVKGFGVERQGSDSSEDFAKRLAALGFKGHSAQVMLRPEQYQILQIDTPAVAPEELRTAARWQIREMVNLHMDDLTLDVLRVGDDKVRATGHLFVVAASNALIREVMGIGQALRCTVEVIDIQDLAQRNLQSAWARRNGDLKRAHAALVLTDDNQALLTISANEELFYTRRIELGAGFMQAGWGHGAVPARAVEAELALADAADPGLGMPSGDADRTQRVVVEVQRSLDLWDRTWPMLVLDRISVYAGERSDELARWLGQELGQPVTALDVAALFPGFEGGADADRLLCWPLLGALLRTESRKL
jgi:MSHA biogenesis protein MshI